MNSASALKRPPAPLPSSPAGESGTVVSRDRRRGRGTVSNATGRYEPLARVAFDDGWQGLEDLPPFKTTVIADSTRKIITRNDLPDISFDRSINPYRGCEHGCVYCFARPTHAYLGMSPGLDFESKLFMKPNAPELLERELSAPGYEPKTIAIGTNTDPYQPIERRYKIMRRILEVLEHAGHPVGIVTKSALVLRDLDILARMAKRNLVKVALSVTTLDPKLARIMEPRAPTPSRRLDALHAIDQSRCADRGDGGADDSGDQRRRNRTHSRSGRCHRRAPCRLRVAAAAARDPRSVQRMAEREFPGSARSRVQARPRHPRRQGLRLDMGQTANRNRTGCLDDRPAI